MAAPDPQAVRETVDTGMFTDDWFKSMDSSMPDVTAFLDMGYLGMDQSMMGSNDMMGLDDFNGIF
jgi:hypothetical protein